MQPWTVFVDGSAFPNPGKLRVGGVIHGPNGGVVHHFSLALQRTGCNNVAEALAAIHALEWLVDHCAQHVLLHTDSSILAEQLASAAPKRIERLFALYEKARGLVSQLPSVQVQWIPRHRNTVADALARGELTAAGVDGLCVRPGEIPYTASKTSIF